ncbi:MAG: hypothetical protein BRC40_11020 [Cyanobacteria bacterium QH_8_48_120]|nr:MAG: hypothetical protein BRC34_11960 [Cyanobacteria bacterium QH_1_48_107]PSO60181.1 MAG: hypothetical protein BRC35_02205 [Cyanobacteria bacterium QH_10_48_56]PSO71887.1 MAG: hypothetical protein BRC40_11020 [Cyanobacteria bacterium QH_8_48_120]
MDAFQSTPPEWTETAIHALEFCCPSCRASSQKAQRVWINRRAPVMGEYYRRKWQEFYQCECGTVWWAWSSDRPPSELIPREKPPSV